MSVSSSFLPIALFLSIYTIIVTSNEIVDNERFYVDVPPGSRQYASLIKATQRVLNQRVVHVNTRRNQDVPFRKIVRIVAVKTVQDIADAGFNRVRVITAPTNCTVGQISRSGRTVKCTPLQDKSQQDCRVSIQYNYFPHPGYNPGPKTKIQCSPVK